MHGTPARVVTVKVLAVALVLTALVSIGGATAVNRLVLDEPKGEVSPAEVEDAATDAADLAVANAQQEEESSVDELDPDEVFGVLESDTERLAGLLEDDSGEGLADLASRVDDVASATEQVSSDLSSLCSDLTSSDALSSEFLSCP